jgi:hypothetical protein
MDKKYQGKHVNMNKNTTALVEEAQADLTRKLGFKPSLSDTVSYLAKAWKETQPKDE